MHYEGKNLLMNYQGFIFDLRLWSQGQHFSSNKYARKIAIIFIAQQTQQKYISSLHVLYSDGFIQFKIMIVSYIKIINPAKLSSV